MSPAWMRCIEPAMLCRPPCRSAASFSTQFRRSGCISVLVLDSRCMPCSSLWARLPIAHCTYNDEHEYLRIIAVLGGLTHVLPAADCGASAGCRHTPERRNGGSVDGR